MGLQQFSGKTVKELGLIVKDYRQRSRGIVGDAPTDETHSPRELRWARTTTDVSINGLYPSAPATKFVVEFGELELDDSDVGNETATFTAYDPREVRVAYSASGWLAENTVVRITWHHGRWYILSEGTLGLAETMLAAEMCPTDADTEQHRDGGHGEIPA